MAWIESQNNSSVESSLVYFAWIDFNAVKPLNSGDYRSLKNRPLLRGVRYWEVI